VRLGVAGTEHQMAVVNLAVVLRAEREQIACPLPPAA